MGDIMDDLRADDQFAMHDAMEELRSPPDILVSTDRGNIVVDCDGIMLYRGRDHDKITTAINGQLTILPESKVIFNSPGIPGIVYTIRYNDGRISRWFRTNTSGAFQRRRTYADQNPGATVSFHLL